MGSSKKIITNMFASGGIAINGTNPWDMQVHNEKLYDRILSGGSIGFGEAYMDGWWDCEALDDLFFRIQYHRVDKQLPMDLSTVFYALKAKYKNMQTKDRAKEVVRRHYDLMDDVFEATLDKRMLYSCGYWETATTLDESQEDKLDLICRKLKLEPGMRLLDMGCGWGGLAKFAAEKYGVSVVGLTISEEQAKVARKVNEGLPVEIRVHDYRDLHDKFDRIAVIAMTEHIGYRNYRAQMETVAENLADDGIALIHTIGGNYPTKITDPWIDKYIFPNGMLPSAGQLSDAWKGLLILEDWHNFGIYYDRTCMEWRKKFEDNWDSIKANYDETFYRMWRYYLSCSAASFRSRKNHLWQIVLTKPKHLGVYKGVR
jgi:cyclopropane-fatty-acyl-phospholipid synthase